GDEAQVLAGGTDVMLQHMRREITPSVFLHIGRLDTLREITANDGMSIGPLISHRTLATDPRIARSMPALTEAAETVGSWQTQEVGTVGGNLCNASPAADTVPPLLVAGAVVELSSTGHRRNMPLDEFLVGRRSTARRSTELLTGISADAVSPGTGETYLKVGRRSAMEVAIVGLAVRLTVDPDDTVTSARVAVCSVAPHPYRATAVELILEGSHMEPDVIAEAGRALTASASPIDDARASADYRGRVMPHLLERAIGACLHRARAGRKGL
ncbi:MAG: xanthine dehydrogenase family protein subunit M, partial [Acidimicrobiia bacterium]|nr:xanthine dehydrogenase family protein subunit M [Acidimicrobiia bacterium]